MKISAGHEALQPLVERAAVLAANHTDLPGRLVATLTDLDATQLGDPALASALDHFAKTWNSTLDVFADDTRTLVEILREVDRSYVDAEMTTAATFTDAPTSPSPDLEARTRWAMP